MTIQYAIIKKHSEVVDLYSRGLLSAQYIAAWEDVMKIINVYNEIKPIHIFANENKAIVRFAAEPNGTWKVTIRPLGINAEIFHGNSYEESEFKAREYIKKNCHKWIAK